MAMDDFETYEDMFITLSDDEGNTCNLELIASMDYNGVTYKLFETADLDEDDEEFGSIILRSEYDENDEEIFSSIEDEALEQEVFDKFSALIGDMDDEG